MFVFMHGIGFEEIVSFGLPMYLVWRLPVIRAFRALSMLSLPQIASPATWRVLGYDLAATLIVLVYLLWFFPVPCSCAPCVLYLQFLPKPGTYVHLLARPFLSTRTYVHLLARINGASCIEILMSLHAISHAVSVYGLFCQPVVHLSIQTYLFFLPGLKSGLWNLTGR